MTVDIIASEGEGRVRDSMTRKAAQADKMFAELVTHMNNANNLRTETKTITPIIPAWLS